MKNFKTWLDESAPGENDKSHYTHIEDELIINGAKAIPKIMASMVDLIKGLPTTDTQTKIDGCVHEDTVIMTNLGERTILDLEGVTHVMGHDFDSNLDKMVVLTGENSLDGNKKWVEIVLEHGSIKVTEDHEVYTTNRGWVEARELVPGDDIKQI